MDHRLRKVSIWTARSRVCVRSCLLWSKSLWVSKQLRSFAIELGRCLISLWLSIAARIGMHSPVHLADLHVQSFFVSEAADSPHRLHLVWRYNMPTCLISMRYLQRVFPCVLRIQSYWCWARYWPRYPALDYLGLVWQSPLIFYSKELECCTSSAR